MIETSTEYNALNNSDISILSIREEFERHAKKKRQLRRNENINNDNDETKDTIKTNDDDDDFKEDPRSISEYTKEQRVNINGIPTIFFILFIH